MKIGFFKHYKPVILALKKAGFKIEEVVKENMKVVITVSSDGKNKKKLILNEKKRNREILSLRKKDDNQ